MNINIIWSKQIVVTFYPMFVVMEIEIDSGLKVKFFFFDELMNWQNVLI